MYEKVKKQFEHAVNKNDEICKFNSLWISFNCFYNLKFNKGNDRNNINFIKNNTEIKQIFGDLNDDLKVSFYDFINKRNGINILKNGQILDNISYICMNCFGEWLEIIYTIRNNQFHGGKDWENEIDILTETNKILETYLKKLYEHYSILEIQTT